jgi:hypothetical protein
MSTHQRYTPSPFFDARKPRRPAVIEFRAHYVTGFAQNVVDFVVVVTVGAITLASEPIHNLIWRH